MLNLTPKFPVFSMPTSQNYLCNNNEEWGAGCSNIHIQNPLQGRQP